MNFRMYGLFHLGKFYIYIIKVNSMGITILWEMIGRWVFEIIHGIDIESRTTKSEAISAINIGLVILPVIAFLSLISIGKNFAKQKKYQIDSTQGKRLQKRVEKTNQFLNHWVSLIRNDCSWNHKSHQFVCFWCGSKYCGYVSFRIRFWIP